MPEKYRKRGGKNYGNGGYESDQKKPVRREQQPDLTGLVRVTGSSRKLPDKAFVVQQPPVQAGGCGQSSHQQKKEPEEKRCREQVLILKWWLAIRFQAVSLLQDCFVKMIKPGQPGCFSTGIMNLKISILLPKI